MENPIPSNELTTTLHLGLRSVADSSPAALIESLLEKSSPDEKSVIQSVMNGSAESAMVFIHRGPSRGARFLITSDGVSIGRASSNDIFLDDITVSRSHATIKRTGSVFEFADSGSLNGSYINNQQTKSHILVTGDEIQIGKFHLLFICSQSPSGEK
jgi:pSer/pThr/pTyr-binding forkhead associated (FHA) protein